MPYRFIIFCFCRLTLDMTSQMEYTPLPMTPTTSEHLLIIPRSPHIRMSLILDRYSSFDHCSAFAHSLFFTRDHPFPELLVFSTLHFGPSTINTILTYQSQVKSPMHLAHGKGSLPLLWHSPHTWSSKKIVCLFYFN